jgi:hypothetical protein
MLIDNEYNLYFRKGKNFFPGLKTSAFLKYKWLVLEKEGG